MTTDPRELLAEIQQRADAATPGPWERHYLVPALTGDGPTSVANAEFIAHARHDVPKLVAALTAVLDATRYVLETAEEQGESDFGGWAPEALAKQIESDITSALAGTR